MRIGAVFSYFKSFANRVSNACCRTQHVLPSLLDTTPNTTPGITNSQSTHGGPFFSCMATVNNPALSRSSGVLVPGPRDFDSIYEFNCLDLDAPYLLGLA